MQDAPLVLSFIHELADFERATADMVPCTEQDIRRDGFGSSPRFNVIIAEWEGQPAGMALYFYFYSTWQGKPGIYLEDLYVRPKFRGKGIGHALLQDLARAVKREKCLGLRWEVLDWNKEAIGFYQGLGAHFREKWKVMQMDGKAIDRLIETRNTIDSVPTEE
ncbi:MAG TPA: GNAT family N-acetyltransferase [Candidatus Binatus sp.]|nr:GNAT family N-acetyltransferase [Candidatus Binatus sp.]